MVFRLPTRLASLFGETMLAIVWSLVPLTAGIGAFYSGLSALSVAFVAIGAAMLLMSVMRTSVIAGEDGVAIHWLGRTRFIPYDAIVDVTPHVQHKRQHAFRQTAIEISRGVLVRTTDGGSTYLVCDDVVARDLVAHTNERLSKHRQRNPAEVPALRRGDRSFEDWIATLRGLLATDAYRSGAVTAEALWEAVENPRSTDETRAAAAVALRAHFGESARPRLRVAIDECAAPKLRVALEAIDEDDARAAGESLARLAAKR